MKKVIFIMGVSGSGKSTIGELLSQDLGVPYFDGDDFHSKMNIAKMSKGEPLNDDDRQGWLKSLNVFAKKQIINSSCIIGCSALKESYRKILSFDIEEKTKWIYLSGSFNNIYNRINSRKDHFMPSELLQSQFDILEEPKRALKVDINSTPDEIIKIIKEDVTSKSEFGLFGLGVMGKSLSRNFANNGFKMSMFNRHVDDVEVDVAENFKSENPELSNASAFDDISAFVNSLEQPRRIMLMVNAGKTIDFVIEDLLPHLSENDIIIDGGNSNYKKTKERFEYLKAKNIHFIGAGISGGEAGALKGPSIMPSGDFEAYKYVQPFLETISAKDQNNLPCCTYVGSDGSGHFIKMVHNGIEYVEMQLLAEVTTILEANQFARIINHYQGFKLISEASNKYNWNLNLSEIARIWTNGCIIKSTLMEDLVEVFKETSNILTNDKWISLVNQFKPSVKKLVSQCVLNDVSVPALSESIQFFNGITTAYSSANVIQAQRDYFGAHTYQRLADDSGKHHHTNWN